MPLFGTALNCFTQTCSYLAAIPCGSTETRDLSFVEDTIEAALRSRTSAIVNDVMGEVPDMKPSQY